MSVLEEAGIQFVFGMPGGDTGRIFDALDDSKQIQTVLGGVLGYDAAKLAALRAAKAIA